MEQMVQEIDAVAENVQEMNAVVENTVKHLRSTADYLDQVSKNCKVASAAGSGAQILSAVMTVGGGIATVMTGGAATSLYAAGTVAGMAGTGIKLGANAIESSINSSHIQEADGALENAQRAINIVRAKIHLLTKGKSQHQLMQLARRAARRLGPNHLVVTSITSILHPDLHDRLLSEYGVRAVSRRAVGLGVTGATTTATRGVAETGSREASSIGLTAGASRARETAAWTVHAEGKVGANVAGALIIAESAAFLTSEILQLTFTVRDIINNKGSEAARCLRDRADKLEEMFPNTRLS